MAKERTEYRKWQGIFISADIWLNRQLNILEKAILVEVDSLTHFGKAGICTKSNRDFADILGYSEKTVSRSIKKLVDEGLLLCDVSKSDANERSLLVDYENLGSRLGLVFLPGSLCSFGARYGQNVLGVTPNCPEPMDKTSIGYGQIVHSPINRNRSNREVTRREGKTLALPLPDFLNEKKNNGKVYISAKRGCPLSSFGFFDWFENEVLKRYPKFTANNLNDTTLRDWDRCVFTKFGKEISTAAIVELLEQKPQLKGNLPGYSEVVKVAKGIVSKIRADEQRKEQIEKKEVAADSAKAVMPDYEKMPDAKLIEEFQKANPFMQDFIRKKRPGVDRLVSEANRTAV